jgi:His-Xaa-Ser system protein HxsD
MVTDDCQDSAYVFHEGEVRVSFDLRVYRLSAVQKTAYKFAREFGAVLGPVEEHLLSATFEFREKTSSEAATTVMRSFFQELLDQELRERIAEETDAIRSLILAQAYSKTDLIRRD